MWTPLRIAGRTVGRTVVRAVVWAAVLALVAGCGEQVTGPERAGAEPVDPAAGDAEWRWVAVRDVEVRVPADWPHAYPPVRPDCIRGGGPKDPWAHDVPDHPHVVAGEPNRGVPMIGCPPRRTPDSPDPAFGPLPFDLWQPYVALVPARPDLVADDPARADGTWEHAGWRLTRETVGDVLVSVLAPPDRPALAVDVLGSARRVEVTALGCEVTSRVQATEHAAPTGTVPAPEEVEAVAICEYSRAGNPPVHPGLEGSRRISGEEARALTAAIHDAPRGGGPDRPRNCLATMHGDRGLALRFLGTDDTLVGEAHVYYDWCFGNGIVDADGARRLTRASCAPLFAEPPVSFWSGQAPVARACGTFGRR